VTSISLSYDGALADNNVLDMYDAARGLSGFNRSLALTTHLLLNGEIITQAPSLKGAQIIATTPEEGSWKVTAVIVAGIWAVTSAPKDTVPGHLLFSAYDYVVRSTLGFPVDFDKTLAQSHEEYLRSKKITPEKFDSLIEKTEASIADMHRPIVASKSATKALLFGYPDRGAPERIGPELSELTYDYISRTRLEPDESTIEGVISSFNINTSKGRIYVFDEKRPIPFELAEKVRDGTSLYKITSSLRSNARRRDLRAGHIVLKGRRLVTSTGRLKAVVVSEVGSPQEE
jgi:hypothetical protein